jgi:hypothetical protein
VNVIQTVRTKLGGDRIVGLIRNDTGGPVFNVKILVTGSDARGNTSPRLQTDAKTFRASMQPGEIQAFEGQGSLADPITYNVSVQSAPGTGLPAYRDVQAAITGTTKNSVGWLVVQGTVKNATAAPRRNLQIVVAGFDAQGNLQDVGTGLSTPPDLNPGEGGTFSITLPANTANASDLRVSVEAYDNSAQGTQELDSGSKGGQT